MTAAQIARMALSYAARIFTYPLDVFYELLGMTQTLPIYWAMFLFFTVYRLLLAPLLGSVISSGRSDKAKKERRNRHGEEEDE